MLMCDCHEDAPVIYEPDTRLSRLATRRGRKCCSCGERINVGDECLRIEMFRCCEPDSVDERIHGEWRRMADRYMCERCAGLFWALEERGYCVPIEYDQRLLAREAGEIDRERQRLAIEAHEEKEAAR